MKKILYVEDNKDTAQAVKALLSKEGYEVELANNGRECLNKSEQQSFDLFLLDIMLPDMSGWAIFERLRNKTKAKIAFLSAIPLSNERMKELLSAGVAGYIAKPFTKESLFKDVRNILK